MMSTPAPPSSTLLLALPVIVSIPVVPMAFSMSSTTLSASVALTRPEVPALVAARDGMLRNFDLRWYEEVALTVVMAAKGYPGSYGKGSVISGLAEAGAVEGVEIFHAGTAEKDGVILANGGRVLNVSALGKSVAEARARAYAAVDKIKWDQGFCRRDIGYLALARESEGG